MTKLSLKQLKTFIEQYPHEDIADVGGVDQLNLMQSDLKRDIFDITDGFDICSQTLPRQYKTIICMDVFEHILDPVRAAENVVTSLASGGYLFLTTVFSYEKHDYPIDTYRYTDTALKWLFRDLEIIKCWFADEEANKWGRRIRVSLIARKLRIAPKSGLAILKTSLAITRSQT